MSDDQDGCEWVNVSSSFVPDKRPLNGCVCVCLSLLKCMTLGDHIGDK